LTLIAIFTIIMASSLNGCTFLVRKVRAS